MSASSECFLLFFFSVLDLYASRIGSGLEPNEIALILGGIFLVVILSNIAIFICIRRRNSSGDTRLKCKIALGQFLDLLFPKFYNPMKSPRGDIFITVCLCVSPSKFKLNERTGFDQGCKRYFWCIFTNGFLLGHHLNLWPWVLGVTQVTRLVLFRFPKVLRIWKWEMDMIY